MVQGSCLEAGLSSILFGIGYHLAITIPWLGCQWWDRRLEEKGAKVVEGSGPWWGRDRVVLDTLMPVWHTRGGQPTDAKPTVKYSPEPEMICLGIHCCRVACLFRRPIVCGGRPWRIEGCGMEIKPPPGFPRDDIHKERVGLISAKRYHT